MYNSVNFKVRFSAILLLSGISHNVSAQCVDTDGDGWGWDGVSSCLVESVVSTCIDSPPVGDGWGWDGVQSCRVTGAEEASNRTEDNAAACVDSDGDGWGWNGVESCLVTGLQPPTEMVETGVSDCIDLDGDGWGWDGTQSCVVNDVPGAPVENQASVPPPYRDRYQTATDVNWGFGGGSLTIEDRDRFTIGGWVEIPTMTINPFLYRCEDFDTVVEDPSNPGLFFDAARGRTCSITPNLTIPAPDPVVFTQVGLEVFYEHGNEWDCREETRPSMDTEFEPNGRSGGMNFPLDGSERAVIRVGDATFTERWGMSGDFLHLIPFRGSTVYRGRVSFEGERLNLYRTGLRRLSCQQNIQENFPFTLYGEDKAELYWDMWTAFIGDSTPSDTLINRNSAAGTDLVPLPGSQVIDRTMSCALLYSVRREQNALFQSQFELNVESLGDGDFRFNVDGNNTLWSTNSWTQPNDGEFVQLTGDGGNQSVFYRYAENLSLISTFGSGTSGSTRSVVACETISQ